MNLAELEINHPKTVKALELRFRRPVLYSTLDAILREPRSARAIAIDLYGEHEHPHMMQARIQRVIKAVGELRKLGFVINRVPLNGTFSYKSELQNEPS